MSYRNPESIPTKVLCSWFLGGVGVIAFFAFPIWAVVSLIQAVN